MRVRPYAKKIVCKSDGSLYALHGSREIVNYLAPSRSTFLRNATGCTANPVILRVDVCVIASGRVASLVFRVLLSGALGHAFDNTRNRQYSDAGPAYPTKDYRQWTRDSLLLTETCSLKPIDRAAHLPMGYENSTILIFFLFGLVFVFATVAIIGRLLRPRVVDPSEPGKLETYECGEPTVGTSWVRFDIRFYTLALIFLIFDVEVTFLYPWALVFKKFQAAGVGGIVFAEVLLFLLILGVGFIYCWRKGDLDWVKSVSLEGGAASKPAEAKPKEVVESASHE